VAGVHQCPLRSVLAARKEWYFPRVFPSGTLTLSLWGCLFGDTLFGDTDFVVLEPTPTGDTLLCPKGTYTLKNAGAGNAGIGAGWKPLGG